MSLRLVLDLHRATHQVMVWLEDVRARLDLTQAEAHVLAFLGERRGAAGLAEVHRSFGHKRSTLTGIVDRLEARGLLGREIHPRDRRSFLLRLTPAGLAAAQVVLRALRRLERRVLGRVTPAQVAGFEAVVAALGAAEPDR
jgi:DNA-binding MarR family transcriptional regulator